MEPAEIRPAQSGDAEGVFALLRQFAVSYAPDRAAFDRHFPRLLTDPDAELLVASEAKILVGYALGFRLLTLYANGAILELQELMVDPGSRGRGIGRSLVEALME